MDFTTSLARQLNGLDADRTVMVDRRRFECFGWLLLSYLGDSGFYSVLIGLA